MKGKKVRKAKYSNQENGQMRDEAESEGHRYKGHRYKHPNRGETKMRVDKLDERRDLEI
jgi:hypothetical protein